MREIPLFLPAEAEMHLAGWLAKCLLHEEDQGAARRFRTCLISGHVAFMTLRSHIDILDIQIAAL